MKKYGVMVEGEFEERELEHITARGFRASMWGRVGTYDEYVMKEIVKSYGSLSVEDKVVLDIGANIGCFSRWAVENGARKVIAIEPEPNNFAMLELNMEGHENVVPVNAALVPFYSGEGVMELYIAPSGKNPGNSSLSPRRGRSSIFVSTVHVDAIFTGHPDISVAKIDCEGAEFGLMPVLTRTALEQMALEYHINGFGTANVRECHEMLLKDGWVTTREPKIQENLWQTIAAYRRFAIS